MLAALFGSTACGEPAPPPRGEAVVTDSAGVRVVRLDGDPEAFATPRLPLDRAYRIGDARSGIELFRVAGARFLPSGALAIANAGTYEVLVVGPDGELAARFGRQGEGPGEFGTITSIHVGEDGTVVTYDDFQGRLTEFEPSGELLGTRPLADPDAITDLIPLIASQEGPTLAVYGDNRSNFRGPPGIRRDTTPLFRYVPDTTTPDTVSLWPARIWSFGSIAAGRTRYPLVFGPELLVGGRSRVAALADTHEPSVSVFDAGGTLVRSVVWEETPRPVTDEEYREWQEWRRASQSDGVPEEIRRLRIEVPHHETHPVLHGVVVDADGGVWIAPAALRTDDQQTWIVLAADGRPHGGVVLPADARILDVTADRVAVLERDELDVEHVVAYTLSG